MKLRNKFTTEILNVVITASYDGETINVFSPDRLLKSSTFHDYEWNYKSLSDLMKHWEDIDS